MLKVNNSKRSKYQTNIAADDTLFLYLYLSKGIRFDVSCESSAEQRNPMKKIKSYFLRKINVLN